MITYQDCPNCGARKIHSTVRLCEVCETWERAEQALNAQDEVLTAKYNQQLARAEKAEKERDEARAEATLLRLERGKMHLALRRVLEALGNGSRANEGVPVDFLCLVPAEVWEVVADLRAALADANAKAEAARAELAALKASLEAT